MNNGLRSPAALARWSCVDTQLPPVEQIKSIHIYDFDNTLFLSPLPNKQLWNTSTFGQLQAQDFLHNGGWWHNPSILGAAGEGMEVEEARAWQGCWNENIVELAKLTASDNAALSVLLTGRGEAKFTNLLQKIFKAKGLQFDIVALKPSVSPNGQTFNSTLQFKNTLLTDIVYTYTGANDLRMYEDRPKHTKAFREFFEDLNANIASNHVRGRLNAEVIQVAEAESYMDPVKEVAEVQNMINHHNKAILDGTLLDGVPIKIKRSVFYTGYLISPADSEKLKTLVRLPPQNTDQEVKWLANNILITPRPANRSIMDKVGGMGARVRWRVTGVAQYDQKVWAARVVPVHPNARVYTENTIPCVVLATRRQAKPAEASRIQQWQQLPQAQQFEFETVVGEKVLLRIDEERENEDNYEASFARTTQPNKRNREEDFPPLGSHRQGRGNSRNQQRPQNGNQSAWNANRSGGIGFSASRGGRHSPGRGRGGRDGGRGNRRGPDRGGGAGGGGGSNRGRGNRGAYRSLDANVGQGYSVSGMEY